MYKEKKLIFQQLLNHNVDLPTPHIEWYNHDGKCIGIRYFTEQRQVEGENREMEHDKERDDMVAHGDDNEQREDEAKNYQTTVNEEYR